MMSRGCTRAWGGGRSFHRWTTAGGPSRAAVGSTTTTTATRNVVARSNKRLFTTEPPSTATTTAAALGHPRIISRRVWDAHQKNHSSRNSNNNNKKSAKDKEQPWPRNVAIAGYVLAAIGIPYSIVWFATSSKDLREIAFVQLSLPESYQDVLRRHFGEEEPNSVTYTTTTNTHTEQQQHQQHQQQQYQLHGEDPYLVRQQQKQIDSLNSQPIQVRISLIHPQDDSIVVTQEQVVQGSDSARPETLSKLIMGGNVGVAVNNNNNNDSNNNNTDTNNNNNNNSNNSGGGGSSGNQPSQQAQQRRQDSVTVAVDFGEVVGTSDKDGTEHTSTSGSGGGGGDYGDTEPEFLSGDNGSGMESFHNAASTSTQSSTYSTWHYLPSNEQNAQQDHQQRGGQQQQRMSDDQVQESKLNWQIQGLEKELKNPNCTRDMDDMKLELQQTKAELRRSVWKRRLRL